MSQHVWLAGFHPVSDLIGVKPQGRVLSSWQSLQGLWDTVAILNDNRPPEWAHLPSYNAIFNSNDLFCFIVPNGSLDGLLSDLQGRLESSGVKRAPRECHSDALISFFHVCFLNLVDAAVYFPAALSPLMYDGFLLKANIRKVRITRRVGEGDFFCKGSLLLPPN